MSPTMDAFNLSPRAQEYRSRLQEFMEQQVYPQESTYHAQRQSGDRWQPRPIIEELKIRAQAAGLCHAAVAGAVNFFPDRADHDQRVPGV